METSKLNQNLVPTRIVNKNGVTTTVHKAPPKTTSTAPIPAPQGMESKQGLNSLQLIIQRLSKAMGNWNISLPKSIQKNDVFRRLESLPEKTRQQILTSSSLHPKDIHFDSIVISMLHKERSPETIDDCLYYYDHTSEMDMVTINAEWDTYGYDVEYGIVTKLDWVRHYNDTLEGYSFRADGNTVPLRELDETTRAQVVALIDFTNFLAETDQFIMTDALVTNEDRTALHIRDTALAQLIVDKADLYEELMRLMKERDTLDPDLLRSVMDNSAQSLKSGVL